MGINVTLHLPHDVAPLVHHSSLATHRGYIDGTLLSVVGGGEQGDVVPNLLNHEVAANQRFAGFGIQHRVAHVVAEGLLADARRLRIKHHNLSHCCFLLALCASFDVLIIP